MVIYPVDSVIHLSNNPSQKPTQQTFLIYDQHVNLQVGLAQMDQT